MSLQAVGGYTILRLLGQGGMSEVYEAHDADLDRRIAIKLILPAMSGEPGFEERFRREARTIASLRHPHIVQIYDFGIADGKPFMAMEYLAGGALKERLAALRQQNQTMSLSEIAPILDALASALDYAHRRGAVHRDIKPGNILFTTENQAVLADFGVARLLGNAGQLTAVGQVIGSPAYMAPEQALGSEVDGRSDQYALGVVLYEMVTGRTPFVGDSPTDLMVQHTSSPPPPPRTSKPDLPEAVEMVILKALAKQPAQRFGSVGELATAFRQALARQGPLARQAPAIDVTQKEANLELDAPTRLDVQPTGAPTAGISSPSAGPAPTDRGGRALSGLLKVASVFAPLVGQQAASADNTPRELRARLAATMGAIGILLASLQLLIGAFDLISRPLAVLGRVLPYLIVALLIGGALLSVRVAARAASRQQRRRALLFLLVIVLVGVGWGGVSAYNRLRPPDGFLVLIGDFDGSAASRKGDFAQRIGAELLDQLTSVAADVKVERGLESYAGADAARSAGNARKAGMVVWGSYDDFGVTPHVELLRQPRVEPASGLPRLDLTNLRPGQWEAGQTGPSRMGDLSYLTRAPLATTNLDLFAANGPSQIAYVVAAILATGLYVDEQYDDALALFDKALSSAAEGGGAIRGLERVHFQRAVTLHALGRGAEATADLEKAVELDPGFMEAHYNLAIAYASGCAGSDGLTRAIAEAATAARLEPDDARAHRLLGSLYRQAGRDEEALAALQQALRLDPQDPLTQLQLAVVYGSLGRAAEAQQAGLQAVTLLRQRLGAAPADAYSLQLALGDAYVNISQTADAVAAYREAARLEPAAAAAHRGLGNAYYWQEQLDVALDEYQQAAELDPQDPTAPLLIGLIEANRGNTKAAIAAQETAARLSQCDPAPHLLLGGLYFSEGDFARAAAAYEAALERDASNANAWYVFAGLHFELGDMSKTAQAAQEAVARDAGMIEAQRLLAAARLDLGDAEGALAPARTLVKLAPEDAPAHLLLGDIHFKSEQWSDSAAAYERALAIQDDANTRVLAGLARAAAGEIDAAIAHYEAALALDPRSTAAWQGLGSARMGQGDLGAAVEAFERSLEFQDSATTRGQLAALHSQAGDTTGAIAEYEAASRLDPQEPRYAPRLGALYASQGELAKAESAFRAALALDADNAEAHAGLADAAYRQCSINTAAQSIATAAGLAATFRGRQAGIYEAQGRAGDAAAIYAELARAPLTDWLAHLTVADYYFRVGRLEEATRAYQQLLEAGSAPPGYVASLIHSALGQIDYAQERLFAAESEFQQALAAFEANVDATAGLADLTLAAGEAERALALYETALPQVPQYLAGMPAENVTLARVSLYIRQGLALERLGEPEHAAAALEQAAAEAEAAVALTPRSPVAQFALGAAHLAAGETEQAEAAFTSAAECDQTLIGALDKLEDGLARLRPAQ